MNRHTRSVERSKNSFDERSVRIATLLPLADILANFGVDVKVLLADAGIDQSVFENPENEISLTLHNRLVAMAVERSHCPHLGLLVGQRDGLDSLGLAGLLVRHSPDVETAIQGFVRYLHTHVRGATSMLTSCNDVCTLTWFIYEPDVAAVDQVGDGALAVMCNMMRELCGPDWLPIEVRFAHREPDQLQPYRKFFRTSLVFDAEEYSISFSSSWLKRPALNADPILRRVLQKEIEAISAAYSRTFSEQVRIVLRTALMTGHSRSDQVAGLLSLHSATLARRLRAEGFSFRQLLDECRYEVARDMLSHSALGVSHIASMLDYSDATAFSRAFRRWSGTTPVGWRSRRRE